MTDADDEQRRRERRLESYTMPTQRPREPAEDLRERLEQMKIEVGAQALMKAFPTLRSDFTDEWFYKAARIVLKATK